MKFYNLDTEFTFGKFEGKTVREVLDIKPSYIDWCAINLDHFFISDDVIEEIKAIIPNFSISEEGQNKLNEKYETWETEQESYAEYDDYDDYHRSYDQDELEMADWDYDPMNPAHDPSENPWIDVFGPGDEAETAYWNTD